MATPTTKNVTIENARIGFRNFSGKEGQYNREGDRNFAVFLTDTMAAMLENEGWRVKYLKARDEDSDPQPYLHVSVSYKARPPRIVMIGSRGRTTLGEDEVNILDWAEIRKVDLIITPYAWAVGDKSGVKAYLRSIYVSLDEDELELKYADVKDSAQNVVGLGSTEDEPPWS